MDIEEFEKLYKKGEVDEISIGSSNVEPCPGSKCKKFGLGCGTESTCPIYKTRKEFVREVYYGPWREFDVTETGIWTTIECPICGYTNFWAVGDGDDLF